jgi:predicted negative regulator of RcsB-dependent stress response
VGRRLKRKQIKQDEFITLVDRLIHWTTENWRQAVIALGGAVALGLIYWGVSAYVGSRSSSAAVALDDAIAVYSAPVGAEAAKDAPRSFPTEAAKLDAAEKAFKRITSKYWLTSQARMARLFLARIAYQKGDTEQAVRTLTQLSDRRENDPVVSLATLDLIRLRLAKGEGKVLIPELEAMVAGKDPRLPRDLALFELAQVQEREGNAGEAEKLYRKLTEDFPDSPYRTEAQQRLSAAS